MLLGKPPLTKSSSHQKHKCCIEFATNHQPPTDTIRHLSDGGSDEPNRTEQKKNYFGIINQNTNDISHNTHFRPCTNIERPPVMVLMANPGSPCEGAAFYVSCIDAATLGRPTKHQHESGTPLACNNYRLNVINHNTACATPLSALALPSLNC